MQRVVRTRKTGARYTYEPEACRHLDVYLKEGWKVVMCNKIGEDLEYILEMNEEHGKN